MTNYSFEEIVLYFANQLGVELEEAVDPEGVELELDPFRVVMQPSLKVGGLHFALRLGCLNTRLTSEHLNTLAESNYLGSGTNGCAFALDEEKTTLFLTVSTPPNSTLNTHFQWFTTIINVANQWQLILEQWPEFEPAFSYINQDLSKEKRSSSNR